MICFFVIFSDFLCFFRKPFWRDFSFLISKLWKNEDMKSCKIHRKIRYIVRVARLLKKREDVKTYVGRACKNWGFLRGSAGGKQQKKTANFHRFFVGFWRKKRSKKRLARKRQKTIKTTTITVYSKLYKTDVPLQHFPEKPIVIKKASIPIGMLDILKLKIPMPKPFEFLS